MAEIGTGKPSWTAMLMSLIIPGLGQCYLRKWGRGILIFLMVVTGLFIAYVNYFPSKEYVLLNWSGGRQLRFKPIRALVYTGLIQTSAAWLWGVVDGWKGKRKVKLI